LGVAVDEAKELRRAGAAQPGRGDLMFALFQQISGIGYGVADRGRVDG
jgi:hypothetical protein